MGSVPPQLQLLEMLQHHEGIDVSVAAGAGRLYLVLARAGRSGPCWVCAPGVRSGRGLRAKRLDVSLDSGAS
jgi:hypothetical protein